jgi:hypothetical protein
MQKHQNTHSQLNSEVVTISTKKMLAKSEGAAISALSDPPSEADQVTKKIVELNSKLEKNVADLSADELIEMASRLLIS